MTVGSPRHRKKNEQTGSNIRCRPKENTNQMNIEYLKSNLASDIRLGFGKEMLSRVDGIRHDIAIVGVPAVISVIEALIAENEFLTRKSLVQQAQAFCRPDMRTTVEDLVDYFQGDNPRCHLWFEDQSGFFGPVPGPHADFPN